MEKGSSVRKKGISLLRAEGAGREKMGVFLTMHAVGGGEDDKLVDEGAAADVADVLVLLGDRQQGALQRTGTALVESRGTTRY